MSDDRVPELPASWEAIVRHIAREVAVEVVESAVAENFWLRVRARMATSAEVVPRPEKTPEGASPLPVCGGPGSDASCPAEARREPGNSLGLGSPARSCSTQVDPVGSCTPAVGPEEAGNSSSATVCTCCCACPLGTHGMPDSVRAIERCNVHGYLELRTCLVHFGKPQGKDCADHRPPKEAAASAQPTALTPAPQRGTATGALSVDEARRIAEAIFSHVMGNVSGARAIIAYGDARVREATVKLREAAEAMIRTRPYDLDWLDVCAHLLDELKKASGG